MNAAITLSTALKLLARDNAMLPVKEAAIALGVTEWWVRRLIADGELRAVNVGGAEKHARWRIDPEDLAAFMQRRQSRARDLVA